MAATYSWLSLAAGISQLQGRLANSAFWTATELQALITQALQEWNSLTEVWNKDFVFSASASQTWYSTATLSGSPRLRTVTDAQIYTQMQNMLLEPPSGAGAWTGTNQFQLSDLQTALQRRQDEVIQAAGCNIALLPPLGTTPGTLTTILPDTVLEPRRIRFVPAVGNPTTLTREDTSAFEYFQVGYLGSQPSAFGPMSWSVASEPPLAFDVDSAPNQPGTYDVISLQSGTTFAPPASTLMSVPNDWAYLPMWGALADLLGSESEQTDNARAQYCLKRFVDGLQIMRQSNWLVQANINGVPCDTPSLHEQDLYSVEWQNNTGAWPAVVQAGIDMVGVCPVAACSVDVTLVGNAPILDSGGTLLQVSRDDWDSVLGYAQRLASFKMGGAEFAATANLEQDFYRAAQATNKRLLDMGIFTMELRTEGQRQDENQPRGGEDATS